MKFGFIPTEGGHFYREALEEVVLGEELGFDSVWMEEHHGIKNHYWPSPLMVLAGFAARTSRIRLGTDVVVLPFHHPVKVAEDAAMLDVISNGRLTLGVAIGYRPDEFALFGVVARRRAAPASRSRSRSCGGSGPRTSVTFEGKFFKLENARMEPKPVQQAASRSGSGPGGRSG